ncbi:hypothetical protein MNBD_UNCLBAC01-1834 [hydrothermal vent metagenome]|uniref:LPS-assembly protein LptD n=1 Tax=hydrothermal vent metagenome TaxID=652676 RepID=A0A3B1DPK3_9ZZZZ
MLTAIKNKILPFYCIFSLLFLTLSHLVFAQSEGQDVELNGDVIEYSRSGEIMTAKGNVVIVRGDTTLTCDRVEFSRKTNIAHANGNVRLVMPTGEISGEKMTFNFSTMQGEFHGAKIISTPYYGSGESVFKESDNKMVIQKGFMTTCDHDTPHYKLVASKMDIYPKDKLVMRHVRMNIGEVPLLYLLRFSQNLNNKEPRVIFTPGFNKRWGTFLLSRWNFFLNESVKGAVHVDAREKTDIAWGVDLEYKTPSIGEGMIRTYYMNERKIDAKRFFQERNSPTIEQERFRIQWRHKWEIDEKTNAIMQYSKLSDSTILKDYFWKENTEASTPNSFFLLTKKLPIGALSFRTDPRINRFESKVERLPELRYDLGNQELWGTGFFLKNTTTYSNLASKSAAPSEARTKTMRFNTDGELSYPMKVGILEVKPFVGSQQTYYSRAKDREKYNSIRGIFRTGASLSTKFYRVFDVNTDAFGLDINRLRHIITPSASYLYQGNPTMPSSQLDSFDGIDSLTNEHSISFSLENKLQTKRNGKSIDLVRFLLSSPFYLKESASKGSFGEIRVDIDIKPTDRVTFYFDSTYDTRRDRLSTANFDMYINGGDKWNVNIGKRWNREADDQLTTEFNYKLNAKWAGRVYTRFDLLNGILKEQRFTVRRDLHAWWLDINFNEIRTQGSEIWLVFTLKAFPDMVLDIAGTSFNQRKAGSQSSGGN